MAEFIQFIPIVRAQNLDGVAQPTFGTIQITGGGGVTASVLLSSDKSSVKTGDTFTVKIEVKTNSFTISEYKLVIDFDRTKLSVVDQDSTTPGTQIKLLDDVFTIQDIEKNNNVSSSGRITLDAKTASGNSFQVNKDVAAITFQAQAEGVPVIKVVQSNDGTQLIRSNGSSLSFTTNEVTVQTTAKTSNDNTSGTPISSDGNTQANSGSNQQNNSNSSVSVIPNTGIKDDLGILGGLFLGIFLVGTGLVIARNKILNQSSKKSPSSIL